METDSGFAVKYAALSHCWGPPEKRPPCTLKGNLSHHKEGIPWTKLSQTFKDACALCCDLGIEYLWIDSLCIVQDDATDWKTEAAIMGRTYEEALLVIAASAATDSSQGLFGVRLPDDVAPVNYKGDVRSGVMAYNSRGPKGLVDNGPLNTRAWVLQEYVLARRTAHFTKWGVVWTCSRDPAVAVSEYDSGKQTVHPVPNTWENIIRSYSKREITYKSDKLIAIQGLASSWGSKQGKTPHYGLFLEDMPLCLAWFWSGHGDDKLVRDVEGAPSWSWASVTGSLDFLMRENEEATPGMKALCGRVRPNDESNPHGALLFESSLVKEVDAIAGPFDCVPSYLEDLQAIDAESETLRHPAPGSISWCTGHSNHYEQHYLLVDQRWGNVGWCAFDEINQTPGPISCLPLFKESATPWYMPPADTAEPFYLWCLFVCRVDPEGCGRAVYQRVGWGRILAPAWIEDGRRQDFILV
ncbi:hypothetical protein CkaCkLH20_02032 [Colletotrichum karsti]|uniref:Heterokaryon incompatibility domain-containing protein n=1 Tax=Colletotrichum karsti TaxID=1095194 RepID=A0A9P6LNM3_9PEZI|nr:uncharacterized protein CkaCkLH20_02032 [Colletotrichum karsti]KAF9880078.1 hypothetical protein CkaCkLH20_02032 [Colletotrichum karsti]